MKVPKIFLCILICLQNFLKAQTINAKESLMQDLKKPSYNYYWNKFLNFNVRLKHSYTELSTNNTCLSMAYILTGQFKFNGDNGTTLKKDGFSGDWFDNSNITK